MRCDDVFGERIAPTGRHDPEALARHLAACPPCAARAEADARLGRIWAATQPAEPDEAAFDALWSRVVEAAEAPPEPVVLGFRSRRALAALVAALAAAAALLVAALPALHHARRPDGPAVARVRPDEPLDALLRGWDLPASAQPVEVDAGEVLVLSLGPDGVRVERLDQESLDERNDEIAVSYDLFNGFESIAALVE